MELHKFEIVEQRVSVDVKAVNNFQTQTATYENAMYWKRLQWNQEQYAQCIDSVRTFFETRVTLVASDQNIVAAYSEVKREILRRIRKGKPTDIVPRSL